MDLKNLMSTSDGIAELFEEIFEGHVPKNTFQYTTAILSELKLAKSEQNSQKVEVLVLLAMEDGLNSSYTDVMSHLIIEEWHYSHEDIALCLEEIGDPASIHYLYKAALYVRDFDEGRALSRKCIWALGAIRTKEALEQLKKLAAHEDEIIQEVATIEINSQKRGTFK